MRSCVSSFFLLVLLLLFSTIVYFTHAARFDIKNNCPYTVWAAATPGGGKKLNTYDVWAIDMKPGTNGRIWARTGCSFNEAGNGTCETGDCGGVLECEGSGGQPPNTLAEFSLDTANKDFFDISLVDGFNVPIDFSSTSAQCTRSIECVADINNECTAELKVKTGSVGCNNPCTVFRTDEYCCTSGPDNCKPTNFSRFFKTRCPDAYVYSYDDRRSSTFTCPTGTNYSVVFCPDIKQKGSVTRFNITNNCPFTVWAAIVPGGGWQLESGQTRSHDMSSDKEGRIWARTGCIFNSTGHGRCDSGDCDGLLECQVNGRAPNTLAEFNLRQNFFNISLVEGFNVPMEFSPTSEQCYQGIKCAADINKQCPMELRDLGGCNNPCTVFNNDQFCCKSSNCGSTSYSQFFKSLCPDAYTYPLDDDSTSTFSCPGRTNYKVVFCP
ncbi:hypothetical protein CsatB_003849 [Cannabis sativa]|uniref:thaumatin-like protein isoform X1 n=1 Tax=Cannabis sativa TaxID=3483 RepID=UPI0029CA1443|nr:thaumatin-like protein isoform X1 [Cannabis sativa]